MSGPASQFRSAAVVVERAAIEVQYAELVSTRSDPAIIGALQLASDTLSYAAERLEPPPVAPPRTWAWAATVSGAWVVSVVATLMAVPHPTRPWVLTMAVAGGGLLATLLGLAEVAVWDRHTKRALARTELVKVHDSIAEARTRIAAITATLDSERDAHLEVGRRIESALVWLDWAERAAEGPELPADDA